MPYIPSPSVRSTKGIKKATISRPIAWVTQLAAMLILIRLRNLVRSMSWRCRSKQVPTHGSIENKQTWRERVWPRANRIIY